MTRWRRGQKVNEHKEEWSLERLVDMGSPEKRIRFGIFGGSPAEARRTSERKQSTKAVITMSIKFLGEKRERG